MTSACYPTLLCYPIVAHSFLSESPEPSPEPTSLKSLMSRAIGGVLPIHIHTYTLINIDWPSGRPAVDLRPIFWGQPTRVCRELSRSVLFNSDSQQVPNPRAVFCVRSVQRDTRRRCAPSRTSTWTRISKLLCFPAAVCRCDQIRSLIDH